MRHLTGVIVLVAAAFRGKVFKLNELAKWPNIACSAFVVGNGQSWHQGRTCNVRPLGSDSLKASTIEMTPGNLDKLQDYKHEQRG